MFEDLVTDQKADVIRPVSGSRLPGFLVLLGHGVTTRFFPRFNKRKKGEALT